MEEKVRDFVIRYMKENFAEYYPAESEISDEELYDFLTDSGFVYKGESDSRRWWDEVFTVTRLGDSFIGYISADTTGDESAFEKGWTFDPDTLCYAEPKEITKTIYVRKD